MLLDESDKLLAEKILVPKTITEVNGRASVLLHDEFRSDTESWIERIINNSNDF